MGSVGMSCVAIVGMSGTCGVLFWGDDIDFRSRDAATCHLAHFKTGAHIEGDGCFSEGIEFHAGVYQGAEHHVAAYTGKTFKICSSHRSRF